MNDWSDETRARLECHCNYWTSERAKARLLDEPEIAADIRAALEEIERLTQDLADIVENDTGQAARADAAEADRDEWRETARSEMAGRRAAEAEVERLRAALTGIINVQDDQTIWPAYSNEKGKRMDAAIDHARTALRGGGE